ncbi:MAG: putative O-glycosylation ligase, exosortase A system-associated [Stellaceae bacterium]
MRDLGIAFVILLILGIGATTPFVLTLGYLWTDIFSPQWLSISLFVGSPISALMGAMAIGGYLLLDRRSPPRPTATLLLSVLFVGWMTLTTTWAVVPDTAWIQWNWATKTILFSAFVPFVIRSRVQIEAFLQVFAFSAAGHLLPWGLKTLVDGGGYNRPLGLLGVNSGPFGESSMVAGTIIMLVPLLLVLRRHSLLIASPTLRNVLYLGYIVIGLAGAVGTFARTAIVGAAVLLSGFWLQSRRKILFVIAAVPVAAVLSLALTTQWQDRISTIEDPTADTSADTRLIIWRWTLDYVAQHPFGGGFDVHNTSQIFVPQPDQEAPRLEVGRAPHSIYFQILGEHGWVGLFLFLAIQAASLGMLWKTSRKTRGIVELRWCRDMAKALMMATLTMLACGAFIGIAYQPTLWNLTALSVCVSEYARRYWAQVRADRHLLPFRLSSAVGSGRLARSDGPSG